MKVNSNLCQKMPSNQVTPETNSSSNFTNKNEVLVKQCKKNNDNLKSLSFEERIIDDDSPLESFNSEYTHSKNSNWSESIADKETNHNSIKIPTFVKKLFSIINDHSNNDIINWYENGEKFIIYDSKEFSNKFLKNKKFSNASSYSSFIRQLNMYDFHKIKIRSKFDYFHHNCFKRDYPELLFNIERKKNKKVVNNEFINQKTSNKNENSTLSYENLKRDLIKGSQKINIHNHEKLIMLEALNNLESKIKSSISEKKKFEVNRNRNEIKLSENTENRDDLNDFKDFKSKVSSYFHFSFSFIISNLISRFFVFKKDKQL